MRKELIVIDIDSAVHYKLETEGKKPGNERPVFI